MRNLYGLLLISGLLIGISACENREKSTEDASFGIITKLGEDTLAVENISISENLIDAEVILRSPEVRKGHYLLSLEDGAFSEMKSEWYRQGKLLYSEEYILDGDSLRWSRINEDGLRQGAQKGDGAMLPFIDMIHWPFEIILNRLGEDTTNYRVFTGARSFNFKVWRKGDNDVIIEHPTRGEMDVISNESGQLVSLNAARTTRALSVSRTGSLDLIMLEEMFLKKESEGTRFGALSGRGEGEYKVKGASLNLDFGTPSKRGREIWGGLISYGKLWRTGANRATHFTTDKDLAIGDLNVPAGDYTFFSIPEESALTLIINQQTGQNGQTYDESRDLGRVQMKFREIDELVEVFTIDVVEEGESHLLRLRWDRGEYIIPIDVINGK